MGPKSGGRPRLKRGPRGKVADALRAARAARGIPQAQAAAELGLEPSIYAKWESGTRRPTGLALRYLEELWIPRSLGADARRQEEER